METLPDFIQYVAKDTWEAELEAKVLNSAVKDQIIADTMKPIQLARVRMASKSASKVMEVADSQAMGNVGEEDEPLPETLISDGELSIQASSSTRPSCPLQP